MGVHIQTIILIFNICVTKLSDRSALRHHETTLALDSNKITLYRSALRHHETTLALDSNKITLYRECSASGRKL